MRLTTTAITGLILIHAAAVAAPTDNFKFSLGLSYEHTDNIHQVPQNEVSENIVHTLFSASYLKESPTLTANLDLDVDYTDYLDNAFPDQAVVSSLLNLSGTLSKGRLFWDAYNRYNRVRINYTSADIPTNRENTNYFRSGPRLVFFKNTKQSWDAFLNYVNFYTEKTDSDYNGYIASTSYLRNITRTFSVSMNATHNERSYSFAPINDTFKKTDLVLGMIERTRLSQTSLQAGKTHVEVANLNDSDQSIFRFQYNYNGKTDFLLSYSRELADFSTQYTSASATVVSDVLPAVSNSLFVMKEGIFSVTKNFGKSSLNYNYLYLSSDYLDNTLDSVRKSSQLNYILKLTSATDLKMSGIYTEYDFSGIDRIDIDRRYIATLTRKFLDVYDIEFAVQYRTRGSTEPNFIFQERRAGLTSHYYF